MGQALRVVRMVHIGVAAVAHPPRLHFQSRISGMSSPYLRDVLPVLDQLVAHRLLGVGGLVPELGQAVDHVRRPGGTGRGRS